LELKHTKSHAKIKQDWLRPVSRAAQWFRLCLKALKLRENTGCPTGTQRSVVKFLNEEKVVKS
jgi:hypothetical protein